MMIQVIFTPSEANIKQTKYEYDINWKASPITANNNSHEKGKSCFKARRKLNQS